MGLLDGKVAIVTGGGSGIGQAVAGGFAREGAKVVICGRREDAGAETVSMIEKHGGDCLFVKTDVSKAAEVEALVARTVDRYGKLDAAFNNAGAFFGAGTSRSVAAVTNPSVPSAPISSCLMS